VRRVAIIGGGLAGLTCAYALKQRGIEAVVFEASSAPGGRSIDGAEFLLSPALFRNTFKLIGELGLSGDILPIEPHAGQVYKGRVYRHRVTSATGLLKFKGLNIVDKALLPRMAYLLARYSPHLDLHQPERGLHLDDETVAAFVKRELSQNVLNYLVGPLISTLFFYSSEETSKLLYLMLAKHMYNTRMSTLRGGTVRIARRLSDEITIIPGRPVKNLTTLGGDFSDIVIAVPGDAVLGIEGVEELLSEEDKQFFRECRYQRVVTVRVFTERPADGESYGVSIPRVENFTAATITFHDYIDPSRVPKGHGLLSITGGGENVSAERLLSDLQRLYRVEPQSTQIYEWPSGTPKFPPGRFRQIVAFEKRSRKPGLFFCGDYLMGPFIEAAITTGLNAAAKMGS
jgi:protoporphyrinogen oxidase